ncbi:hypothetical protein BC829DRAFT_415144 [Chytridium lagenaria]|nr:hypothetical protein BC829DRAFT_415144 [Chytridium lagenaria]
MKLSIAILLGATLCHASNTTHITPRDSDTLTSCLQSASSSVIFQTSSASYTTARNGQANLDAMGSADPLAFVFPSTVQEVSAIVKCAVKFSTPITARSGGHSYEAYSINDKGVVVDLTSFVDVRIDTVAETVVVGGGNWLGRWGYVLPGGDCPHVGIGGHALGGGFGLLSRKLGLVIDQVLEVQLVDATGDIRTVNAQTDADLFGKALRGAGGGNFGIVTSFTLKIHKAPSTLGLVQIVWSNPSDRASVIKAFTSITPTLPNEISSSLYTTGFGATSFIAGRYGPNAGFLDEIIKPLFLNALPQTYTVVINKTLMDTLA